MGKLTRGFFVEEASSLFTPVAFLNAARCRVYEDGPCLDNHYKNHKVGLLTGISLVV
jgi:hypothetical protein